MFFKTLVSELQNVSLSTAKTDFLHEDPGCQILPGLLLKTSGDWFYFYSLKKPYLSGSLLLPIRVGKAYHSGKRASSSEVNSNRVLNHQLCLRARLGSWSCEVTVGAFRLPRWALLLGLHPLLWSLHRVSLSDYRWGDTWTTCPSTFVQTPSLWSEPQVMTHEHGCHAHAVCLHPVTLPAPTRGVKYFQLRMCGLVRVSKWMSEKQNKWRKIWRQ